MSKAIHDLLAERFGVRTRVVIDPESNTDVGTTAERLLRADPSRLAFLLQNLDTVDSLYVTPDSAPSSTRGILVPPQGSITVALDEDFALPAEEWFGVADAAATPIFIMAVYAEVGLE